MVGRCGGGRQEGRDMMMISRGIGGDVYVHVCFACILFIHDI